MIDVVMPQMGESIVEGTLTKWLKKAGDRVQRDEPLFEISTDKVDTEIPSPSAGMLAEVIVEEGKTVAINTVVGRIDEKGEAAVAAAPVAAPVPAPAAPVVEEEASGPLSPLVRKMAREYNLDPRQVKGTGAGGRVTKQDIEAHVAAQASPAPAPAAVTPRYPAW
jgi:pyruvate dehydrogenase E2 component (dihydrolipoamide acetyltransferase)